MKYNDDDVENNKKWVYEREIQFLIFRFDILLLFGIFCVWAHYDANVNYGGSFAFNVRFIISDCWFGEQKAEEEEEGEKMTSTK